QASLINAALRYFLPTRYLYWNNSSLMTIDKIIAYRASLRGAEGISPQKIFKEEMLISTPTSTNKRATIIEAMFSAFQCRYGCSCSGGFIAILTPNKMTTELIISEAEWTASAIKARLFAIIPATPLMMVSKRLTIMPIHVAIKMGRASSLIHGTTLSFFHRIKCHEVGLQQRY